MSDKKEQLEKLKQHFGRRVYEQARNIVNSWGALQEVHWNEGWYSEFQQTSQKLVKLADRYEYDSLAESAQRICDSLKGTVGTKAPPSETLEILNAAIAKIAESCSRASDSLPLKQMASGRRPVALCLTTNEENTALQYQLQHFGIPSFCYSTVEEVEQSIGYRLPCAFIVSSEFAGNGIALVQRLQKELTQPIPSIFYAAEAPTIESRLAAVRANGIAFFVGELDFGQLIEQLVSIYSIRTESPFRVLVVDDSRSQSLYAEKTLNQAGIFTRAVNEPLSVMSVIDSFSPDAILMDMYMPNCKGTELAQVIRQQTKYDTIPILYLSAESNVGIQLEALGQGGDDFLTKPVPKEVLITTVLNRCKRYRVLREQLIRDGLTGLVDHNNTLEALNSCINQFQGESGVVSFAMIDLDHFKNVNDNYGHSMGDRVIRALALFLRQRFRVTDVIGRYGGEEFAIVFPETDEETAKILLEEVRIGFEQLVHQEGKNSIQVTFSCGVSQWQLGETHTGLAHRADLALYVAKSKGRNQVVASTEMPKE